MQRQQTDIEKIFSQYPNTDFWKLFIDFNSWGKGETAFDNDQSPGYLKNISRAFFFNFITIDVPLSTALVIGLHDIACHIKSTSEFLGLKESGTSSLYRKSVTREGLSELINNIRNHGVKLKLFPLDEIHNPLDIIALHKDMPADKLADLIISNLETKTWAGLSLSRFTSISDANATFETYIHRYNQEMHDARTDREKIFAIAHLVRDIHQYHPFADGNGRTFVFLLLNKLLITNNLSPCIVEDSWRFSGYSVWNN